jgi:phosphoribulokinase
MSVKYPIVAVTGSSGSGTGAIRDAFAHIFQREGINAQFVEGNSFRRYNAEEMRQVFAETLAQGDPINHFGPRANLFDRLEGLFREYSRSGGGLLRSYLASPEEAERAGQPRGTFTPWEEIPPGSDLLFYKGLHGGCIQSTWSHRKMSDSHNPIAIRERTRLAEIQDLGVDVAQWVDLLIGVVPIVNLEWIQKIHRDVNRKGCERHKVMQTILRYMPDYMRFITPQFSLTDINFQRVPLVDTSNPFHVRDLPGEQESMLVIRFREPKRFDFPRLLQMLDRSFMSRPNTMVIPGGSLQIALEVICTPLVHELVARKRV